MSNFLKKYVNEHINIIGKAYSKCEWKKPLDIIKFLKQNTALRYNINENTFVYIFDSINKNMKKIELKELGNIEEIKKMKNKDIEKYLINKLN